MRLLSHLTTVVYVKWLCTFSCHWVDVLWSFVPSSLAYLTWLWTKCRLHPHKRHTSIHTTTLWRAPFLFQWRCVKCLHGTKRTNCLVWDLVMSCDVCARVRVYDQSLNPSTWWNLYCSCRTHARSWGDNRGHSTEHAQRFKEWRRGRDTSLQSMAVEMWA